MRNVFLLCLTLFYISAINTMDKQNDCMSQLPDDLIIYYIGPRFDRLDRNNFRLTNTRHANLILCQALLNANYEYACEDNDIPKIVKWRNQGALKLYEEISALAYHTKSNRRDLAKRLCSRYPTASITINGLAYAIIQNNLSFAQWILDESKPPHWSRALHSSINYSARLKRHAITKHLNHYIDQEKYNEQQQNEVNNDEYSFHNIP